LVDDVFKEGPGEIGKPPMTAWIREIPVHLYGVTDRVDDPRMGNSRR
jgi:hypothetical protein